ncbi:unnamed protein product [Rotaria sordida]|uniref:Junctophilin n=1 Tax=Rotaria sordida TaxID=392033 RepID=A0A813YG32_9BILA|nr:unnamed protein product [Rotaria sordida]
MSVGVNGGRFDFDDGGTYCGGWNDGKAHGHGVCTGPKGQGEYAGAWQYGYEFSGIYLWPSGNSYEGQWMSGKRHGLGVEKKGRWIYKGEWTQGFKGRYGIRASEISGARYEGTWANGLQDGYGVEIYADGGTYHGQIQQGLRHGYGIRRSVPYGLASRYRSKNVRDSLTSLRSEDDDERMQRERDRRMDENRGGFVLRSRSDPYDISSRSVSQGPHRGSLSNSADRRPSLRKTLLAKLRKQKSTSDIEDRSTTKKTSSFRSTGSSASGDSKHSVKTATIISSHTNTPNSTGTFDDGDHSFISQEDILDNNVVETYMGEWKSDKRSGFGIAERSDGLKYEGAWSNNKKNGYGVTTFRDGTKEEGKYKNNVLVSDKRKPSKLFLLRSSKFRDKIDAALNNGMKAATNAQQKAEIAMARANNARSKAYSAEIYAKQARNDSTEARTSAKAAAPDFRQPGLEKPQPFIPLDIDRQIDGKLVTSNHINISPPKVPLPLHLSQHKTNSVASPAFILDGGVYQGQPTSTKSDNWNLNTKDIGQSLPIQQQQQQQQQHPDYYYQSNKIVSPIIYNNMPDSRTGISMSKQYPHLNQPSSGDTSMPGNFSFNDNRAATMSTGFDSAPWSGSPPSQFVPNAVGIGPRSVPKRTTFIRTRHLDTSTDDLLHDQHHRQQQQQQQQQQQNEYNSPTSNLYGPQHIRHTSGTRTITTSSTSGTNFNIRPPLIHGAPDSQNSSGQDSGLSSGGASFDPEQHHIYNLTNPTNIIRSTTPIIDVYNVPQPIPIPKRKSLPSIVKILPGDYKIDETARSSDNLKQKETFIIENGIRKRVTAQVPTYTESGSIIPEATVMTSSSGSPILAHRVILESVTKLNEPKSIITKTGGNKRGSMPTVVNIARHRHEAPSISREEASKLGSQRREELRRQRDFDSTTMGRVKTLLKSDIPATGRTIVTNMHVSTQEISIQTDNYNDGIQNVIYRNRVFIAIFFLNLSLALWFIQLLR